MGKATGVDVPRVAKLILSVLVLSILGLSTIANAAFFGLPRAFKAPLGHIELSMPISETKDYGPFGIDYLESCQLEQVELFPLSKTLTPEVDQIPSDASLLGEQHFVEI